MTSEEIHFITKNLFVGNKLEQGAIEFEEGTKLDLKNLEEPVIIFASEGDNITPPMQALNWIMKVWGSEAEIKRQKQVIIYLIHKDVGHLGIFVSGKVAKKQHKEIIGNVDAVNYLSPGLYEKVIENNPKAEGDASDSGEPKYIVRYEPRRFEDILGYDDGLEDEEDFKSVNTISEINDTLYRTFVSPFVKMVTNEFTAETLRRLHPNRVPRYVFSDMNPLMLFFKTLSPPIRENRKMVSPGNFFLEIEKIVSNVIGISLDYHRDMNDLKDAFRFTFFYGNPLIESLFGGKTETAEERIEKETAKQGLLQRDQADDEKWLSKMEEGGFAEGALRIMLAIAGADESHDRSEFLVAQKIRRSHPKMKTLSLNDVQAMSIEQSRILQTDADRAIQSLSKLIKTKKDRKEALAIADKMAMADGRLAKREQALIEKIRSVLS